MQGPSAASWFGTRRPCFWSGAKAALSVSSMATPWTWADSTGYIHVRPQFDRDEITANLAPRQTKEEWAAAEAERMWDAWGRPSVRSDVLGKRDAKGRFQPIAKQVEEPRQPQPESDPYWDYIELYNR